MLKTQDEPTSNNEAERFGYLNQDLSSIGMADPADLSSMGHPEQMRLEAMANASQAGVRPSNAFPQTDPNAPTFDMISMGLEEPLPTQDVTEEL